MKSYPLTNRNRVKRVARRGQYDKQTVFELLDSTSVAHVGFVVDDQPFVIPMAYGRFEDRLYLHGATNSRLMTRLEEGVPVCLTVTHFDGIVLARSAFHHSMNYRSVVVFGKARLVEGPDKEKALFYISEQILKDRWEEVRPPNEKELNATAVLEVQIEEASAKIRTGPPSDATADYELPIWAGVLPIQSNFEAPMPDPKLSEGIELPKSLQNIDIWTKQ
ncbi:MAG: pyridoxamine 5'-phosphate oxidase family protein [Bacteroidota bacterium]